MEDAQKMHEKTWLVNTRCANITENYDGELRGKNSQSVVTNFDHLDSQDISEQIPPRKKQQTKQDKIYECLMSLSLNEIVLAIPPTWYDTDPPTMFGLPQPGRNKENEKEKGGLG